MPTMIAGAGGLDHRILQRYAEGLVLKSYGRIRGIVYIACQPVACQARRTGGVGELAVVVDITV